MQAGKKFDYTHGFYFILWKKLSYFNTVKALIKNVMENKNHYRVYIHTIHKKWKYEEKRNIYNK